MELFLFGQKMVFLPVKLYLHKSDISNVFAQKNNKTVKETLNTPKYAKFKSAIESNYSQFQDEPLGRFLFQLKMQGDTFYKLFLNKHGDSTYCEFSIIEYLKEKGIYCFILNDTPKYIGRSHDPFGQRINQGYGHISPKNCYIDGQSPNCHVNSLIATNNSNVNLLVYPMGDDTHIDVTERELIRHYQPEWNIALKNHRKVDR